MADVTPPEERARIATKYLELRKALSTYTDEVKGLVADIRQQRAIARHCFEDLGDLDLEIEEALRDLAHPDVWPAESWDNFKVGGTDAD